jgi:hypothetical protein
MTAMMNETERVTAELAGRIAAFGEAMAAFATTGGVNPQLCLTAGRLVEGARVMAEAIVGLYGVEGARVAYCHAYPYRKA